MSKQELPLFTELTAPNGLKWAQPLGERTLQKTDDIYPDWSLLKPAGLFIDNEFVKSKSGETLSSTSPM